VIDLALFGKSLLLGLAVAAPLGPIGALCISRTLERGFWAGMAGGLGTALADGFYASLAALGFAAFSAVLSEISGPMRLVGGLFLIWLGWKSLQSKSSSGVASVGARDLLGTSVATFALTLANPMTILSFAAMFAGLGLAEEGADALTVVAGVFLGSLAWWIVLSGSVAIAHRRLPEGFARWVRWASGAVLIAFGLMALASLLLERF
jgi:putative LysE/RhtB family amino acid efflux pump